MIVEKDGVNDKLKLLALQSLRELAQSGYHMMLLDLTLVNLMLRYL
jgi:hypothetical protein